MWIEELPNGKYKFFERYTDPYSEKIKKVAVTMTSKSPQASKKALKMLDEKISKKIQSERKSDITFKQLYEMWFPYYKKHVKRTSWIKTEPMLVHIQKVIHSDILVRNIDDSLVNEIIDNMYTFGTLSLNYTKQTKTLLSIILQYAVDKKMIDHNVAVQVKIKPKKAEEEKRRVSLDEKFLDQRDMKIILDNMNAHKLRKTHALMAEFLYLTGLRYGELQALQYKNFHKTFIEITGTLDYTSRKISEAKKTIPKNIYSSRKVPLSNRAIEIVEEMILDNKMRFPNYNKDDYIFLGKKQFPITLHSFNGVLKTVEKETGIEKHLTSHIFRHSHVSLLAELNIPLKAIMDRVGHHDANTTLTIYNHVTKKTVDNLINQLNNL